MERSPFFAILGVIIVGVVSRFLPHLPNFTPIVAIALFSACTIRSLNLSLFTVFASMFLSDLVLGMHSTMPFVYLSFGMIVLVGHWLRSKQKLRPLPLYLVASSFLFFLVTNFGVWLTTPLYPKTGSGLALCYLAALPFLANQIVGDLLFGAVLFGLFALNIKPLVNR